MISKNYTLGIDVSKYQGSINWPQAKLAGARFTYIRAGLAYQNQGAGIAVDQFAAQHAAGAASVDIPFGFYWYFAPHVDSIEQANALCDILQDREGWELPPVLDVEFNGHDEKAHSFAGAVSTALRHIERKTGITPMVYTRGNFWNQNIMRDQSFADFPLWVARYSERLAAPWADGYYRPEDWDTWRFWQFSADGNGRGGEFGANESIDIDLNYFNGDESALLEFIRVFGQPNPDRPPTPTPDPQPAPDPDQQLIELANQVAAQQIELETQGQRLLALETMLGEAASNFAELAGILSQD